MVLVYFLSHFLCNYVVLFSLELTNQGKYGYIKLNNPQRLMKVANCMFVIYILIQVISKETDKRLFWGKMQLRLFSMFKFIGQHSWPKSDPP